MKGIKFILDKNNEKVAVQIDLKIFGELWEGIYDTVLVELTKNEPTTSFDDFIQELKEDNMLSKEDIEGIYFKDDLLN